LEPSKNNFRRANLLRLLQGRFSAERVVTANYFILTIRAKAVKAHKTVQKILS
jgi:hypothetical protein